MLNAFGVLDFWHRDDDSSFVALREEALPNGKVPYMQIKGSYDFPMFTEDEIGDVGEERNKERWEYRARRWSITRCVAGRVRVEYGCEVRLPGRVVQ